MVMAVNQEAPRERRRNSKRAQILEVAWELARRDGIAGISLRELADRVDLRQPSLYTYFGSKSELLDAMFAQGFQQLVDEREALSLSSDPMQALREGCRHFVEFCVSDTARYQLLFQHAIPGFAPTEASMRISGEALAHLRRWLDDAGLTGDAALDLMRALLMGVAGEQIANDPAGRRWVAYADDLPDAVAAIIAREKQQTKPAGRRKARTHA